MLHRLALALGMTLEEAGQRISSSELRKWFEYWAIEPWGEERADLRSGIVAATIANCHRSKTSRVFEPADFMPKFGEPERQGAKEQIAIARRVTRMMKAMERAKHGNHRKPADQPDGRDRPNDGGPGPGDHAAESV